MAKFKAGDRVKRIGGCSDAAYDIVPPDSEGTIVCFSHFHPFGRVPLWDVKWDAMPSSSLAPGGIFNAVEPSLAPLLPPSVDTWAEEAVKKVTKPSYEPESDDFPESEREEFLNECIPDTGIVGWP